MLAAKQTSGTDFEREYGSRRVLELLAERTRTHSEVRGEVAGISEQRVPERYASEGNAPSSAAALSDSRS